MTQSVSRLAIIANFSASILNFRGPLVRELVRRGVTVYALAPDYDAVTRDQVLALGAIPVASSMSRTGMNPFRDVVDLYLMTMQLRKLNLDMSFAYFIKPVIYGSIAARLAGVAERYALIEGAGYVFTDTGESSFRRLCLRWLVRQLYRVGLRQAKKVFVLNRDDQALFVQSGMVGTDKVRLIPGIGLDLEHYQVVPIPPLPLCFLFIGRLLREKGVREYIDAVRLIKAKYPEVRCVLLGDVDRNPGSVDESEVQAWVAEGVIEWPGHVADVRDWIAQASVFVLPSYREGLPRSTQEAMAMGRPVITTDVPGCRDTVIDGVNGFMVPARDAEALAQAMLRFVADPALIGRMGAESRRMAERQFDVRVINAALLEEMGMN